MDTTTALSDWAKKIARIALVALLLGLAWIMLAGRGNAQPAVTVRVIGPATAVPAGQTFLVAIAVENAQNLGAFEFEYNFNSSTVGAPVSNIQLGGMLGSTGRTTGELRLADAPGRPGVPLFGAYSYGEANGPNGSGILANVIMNALSPGSSQLNLSELKVTNIAGDELPSAVIAGTVTVIQATPRAIYMPLLRRNSGN
jgi:hypothetical protein